MKLELIIINYHYIGENPYPYPSVYPVGEKKFEEQLDLLGQSFSFIGLDQILGSLKTGNGLPEKSCLITFDDGIRSQYDIAWPILKRKGIPAVFYTNTEPLKDNIPSTVHKTHWLRGNIEFNEFKATVLNALNDMGTNIVNYQTVEIKHLASRQYPYDSEEVATFKYILNFIVDWEVMVDLMNDQFRLYYGEEGRFCGDYYFGENECRILAEHKALGCHGHRHIPVSRLSLDHFRKDLTKSLDYLSGIAGAPITSLTYPFGGNSLESQEIIEIVKDLGVEVGFTTNKIINQSLDNRYFLGRFNTNDVPGGSKPIIDFSREVFQE